MKARFVPVAVVLASLLTASLRADTAEQVIAQARAYLGTESALNAVTTVHFRGRLESAEQVPAPDDKTKLVDRAVSLSVDIIFQKPFQQMITLGRADEVETTALDGYDAWQRRGNPQKPSQWQLTLLDGVQIKRLRANTWENLSFFAGLEKKGGRVQMEGETTVDGTTCTKLSFIHDDRIVFVRYFDKATGRLIKTETENGTEIREEGEMMAGGIRFPKKVINKPASGQVTTITFDTVVLNEVIPASQFAVPALKSN